MKKLIELILTCENGKIEENPKIRELIELLSFSSEGEFKKFIDEYEEVARRVSLDSMDRAQEILEFICKKVTENEQKMTVNNNGEQSNVDSLINSPEKQSQSTRWTVSREERKRILETMERLREDQKRRKKKNWSRLEEKLEEFEEFWSKGRVITKEDLKQMRKDEGIEIIKNEHVNVNVDGIAEPELKKSRHKSSSSPSSFDFIIVDFDCIKNLLINLAINRQSESAKFLLETAENVYRSELMFYTDLREFDQPSFSYYADEDDMMALKFHDFEADDLGRFARKKSYRDSSKKFYKERAFRHRYISRKPYDLFFSESTLKKLKEHFLNLDNNCKEFHFWITNTINRRGIIYVSGSPLLQAFSLLLVLSRTVKMSTKEISESIWSFAKFKPEWTLKEILKGKLKHFGYFTTEKDSKLSREVERIGLEVVQFE